MSKKNKIIIGVVVFVDVLLVLTALAQIIWPSFAFGHFAFLSPKGEIASKERTLMIKAIFIMLLVAIPMFAFAIHTVWRYRAGTVEPDFSPDVDGHGGVGVLFWLISCSVIFCIAILIWQSSHELDPFRKLDSKVKPITIQVVALNWKWLFIYPDLGIATVNMVEFPEKTPVNFQLTSDAPMNTFWIPQLAGQVYAMAGMESQLHLMADTSGVYDGSSTEINGKGYSGMRFKAVAVSSDEFTNWVKAVHSQV